MCLSSCDPSEEDFVVAVKFKKQELSVCRPRCDSKWTHIDVSSSSSELMYSKRDRAFYCVSSKGLYMGSLALTSTFDRLEYQKVRLRNAPKISDELMDRCNTSKHLVESPSGELLFIKFYKDECKVEQFMVFREDVKKKKKSKKKFCYTEDIGDLCIFLGKSEPFCLSATMYPGLKPNSIYYILAYGVEVISYDIASGTICPFRPGMDLYDGTYWLHP